MVRSLLAVVILLVAAGLEYAIDGTTASAGLQRILVVFGAAIMLVATQRGHVRDTALMLASLFLGLGLVEGWMLHAERPAVKWTEDTGMPRDLIGFSPLPGVHRMRATLGETIPIFDAAVTVGDDGLRVSTAPKGSGALAFLGDSYTFGAGLEDKDTIVQAASNLMHDTVPMPNVSFNGWSPANLLAILQHDLWADQLRGARHFVLMTAPWHIERTACKVDWVGNVPRFVVGKDGRLVQNGVCPTVAPGPKHGFLHGFAIARRLIEPRAHRVTPADAENYFAIVDTFVALAKSKYGVDTTILVEPNPAALSVFGMTEKQFEDRLGRSGADVLADPLPIFAPNNPYIIAHEVHPTALANRLKAKLLIDRLAKTHPGMLPTTTATLP